MIERRQDRTRPRISEAALRLVALVLLLVLVCAPIVVRALRGFVGAL